MTRTSKQAERRNTSPRKHRNPSKKTGSRKDCLELGYRPHANALEGNAAAAAYIPKVK